MQHPDSPVASPHSFNAPILVTPRPSRPGELVVSNMVYTKRRLTVLGSCGAFPEIGRACVGHLLEWDGFKMILDFGYGTFARFLQHCPDGKVDMIFISHDHPDHCVDLHALFRMHRYGREFGTAAFRKIHLLCLTSLEKKLGKLEEDEPLEQVFEMHWINTCSTHFGPFRATFYALQHHVPNFGIRLEVKLGSTSRYAPLLAYTGDTGATPLMKDLAWRVALFICEATDRPGEVYKRPEDRKLMSSWEAGYAAANAEAKNLLLTHFWPGNDRFEAVKNARTVFNGGNIWAASENQIVTFYFDQNGRLKCSVETDSAMEAALSTAGFLGSV